MKPAGTPLINYLATATELLYADLWSLALKNGITLYYADSDYTIGGGLTVGGHLYKTTDVLIDGAELDQQVGLTVNETDVTCTPNQGTAPSMVGSMTFLSAAQLGLFNRAVVKKSRLFMQTPGDTSLGAVLIFLGEITDLTVTRTQAIFKCKDLKNLLNIYLPRRQYQPTCSWVFGDANCGFDRASLTVSSSIEAGSSTGILVCGLSQVAGYFNNGTVEATSGINNGISRTVKTYSPNSITLVAPFPNTFANGDTFNITPGCTKNYAGSIQQFNGSVSTGDTPGIIQNNNGAAGGAYNGMSLTFTVGTLSGQSQIIESWTPGRAVMKTPFTGPPSPLDEFNIVNPAGNVVSANNQVTTLVTQYVIPTSLTLADGFFTNGIIQFTSGVNVGQQATVTAWASGIATISGVSNTPAVGDEFSIESIGTNTQGTCTGYWGTDAPIHFGGEPYIPVPETAY